MSRSYNEEYNPVLEAAMEQEIGLFVRVGDYRSRTNLENILYELRQAHAPEYDELAIFRPVIDGDENILFIAKKTVELPE